MVEIEEFTDKLIEFRKRLHRFPELSGCENSTSKLIVDVIESTNPTRILTGIGGHGVAAIYDSGKQGPTVLLRGDMDALPIQESNTFDYRSAVEGVAHLCGHDGHSAIIVGVGHLLKVNPPTRGRVVLLFQPSEETGQGAAQVINDPKFPEFKPDFAFALHNLPGFKRGDVFVREGTFASASTGMIIKLKGLSSHAAHPEDGNNPDKTMANIVIGLNELIADSNKFNDFTLLTVIHTKLGEVAFGTTPGNAVVMATLRTYLNSDMDSLRQQAEELVKNICHKNKINFDISYTEEFPATSNSSDCVGLIRQSAKDNNIQVNDLDSPFRWSEDFGHFTQNGEAALFGVGSGINHPQLHNEDYDFPDDIIEPAVKVFYRIVTQILED
ncbi:MAG: amidohydrolase [Bacteroidales bacterium]